MEKTDSIRVDYIYNMIRLILKIKRSKSSISCWTGGPMSPELVCVRTCDVVAGDAIRNVIVDPYNSNVNNNICQRRYWRGWTVCPARTAHVSRRTAPQAVVHPQPVVTCAAVLLARWGSPPTSLKRTCMGKFSGKHCGVQWLGLQ